jgi:hypothetical protein
VGIVKAIAAGATLVGFIVLVIAALVTDPVQPQCKPFKRGMIVTHKLTGDKVMVLQDASNSATGRTIRIRTRQLARVEVSCDEVTP